MNSLQIIQPTGQNTPTPADAIAPVEQTTLEAGTDAPPDFEQIAQQLIEDEVLIAVPEEPALSAPTKVDVQTVDKTASVNTEENAAADTDTEHSGKTDETLARDALGTKPQMASVQETAILAHHTAQPHRMAAQPSVPQTVEPELLPTKTPQPETRAPALVAPKTQQDPIIPKATPTPNIPPLAKATDAAPLAITSEPVHAASHVSAAKTEPTTQALPQPKLAKAQPPQPVEPVSAAQINASPNPKPIPQTPTLVENRTPLAAGPVPENTPPLPQQAIVATAQAPRMPTLPDAPRHRAKAPLEPASQYQTAPAPKAMQQAPLQPTFNLQQSAHDPLHLKLTNNAPRFDGLAPLETATVQQLEQTQNRGGPAPQIPTATIPQIARQLADVMPQLGSRQMTISLSPDELGKVQLSLAAAEKGMVVNVITERVETMDLMRRNIAELGQEFRAMGYENIAFSFANSQTESGSADADEKTQNDAERAEVPATTDLPNPIAKLSLGASTSVDIRL